MRRKNFWILIPLFVLMLLMPGTWNIQPAAAQQAGLPIFLPVINRNASLPPPDAASARISVPAGFAIRIFASNLTTPRLMTVGPDGWIYVAELGTGKIVGLPDSNHDGVADGAFVIASGLNEPQNVEWHNGWLYVGENGRIDRLADLNKDGFYETHQLVTDNIPGAGGHVTRTMHFGPDGKMYVSTGSTCNICAETDPRRAAILRFNPDGSIPSDNPFANDPDARRRPVWAWGLRNTIDFLWTPSGALWANMMGSDALGDNVPPEVLIAPIVKGGWYGWPYCYNPNVGLNQPAQPLVPDTRLTPPAGVSCSQAKPALLTDPAHSAPEGMALANNSAFSASYQDDLFVAEHGSWNTTDPANYRDCKVEQVVISSGKVVRAETFANGWRAPGKLCGDPTTWGRPAGVTFGSDGAMYISDDKAGRIYRVVYTGP